jgi:dolichyl-diphosphooligosaccharide--protein glycosyltransferase
VIALAWQGWAYVFVILIIWFAAELFLDRFRNEDTMGTWIVLTLALATPLLLALQWYTIRNQIRVWYDVPAYLFLAAFVLGLAFTVTRDYPWTLVIPSTLLAGVIGLAVGVVVNPSLTNAFFTGAGYFVQSKVVTTIAEDQTPGMSQLILSFGLFTFGLTLAAVAYLIWQIPRRHDPAYNIVVIWVVVAIFMAINAARFIFNASPAFAVAAGYAIDQVLQRANFTEMRRTYRSLAAGSWRNALRKSLKPRHVLAVLGIVFLILLPNVWWAVDASIPFELKTQYDRQVARLLPDFLRAPAYNPTSPSAFYFGAFGYSLPKPSEYYPAAWSWFATRDADRPPELRPAYLSWWDYGFEAVDRGAHPTVADNFQNGYQIAGQFITSQNETEAIALMAIRLVEGDFRVHRTDFSPGVQAVLRSAGLSVDTFRDAILHPSKYISVVLSDPLRYGAWASDMQPLNAEFVYLLHILSQLDLDRVVSLYHALRDATGWEIGYFAVDSRLFPISVQNTGIFYAPVKLSDHRVVQLADGRILPIDFFQIFANTNRGQNIPIQLIGSGDQIQGSQTIQYQPAFYRSMFYRSYIGYSPTDLGVNSTGIPGIDASLQAYQPAPSWNLTHFRVVYRTSYYNPFPDPRNHTDAWRAMNYDEAQRLQADIAAGKIKGVVDPRTMAAVENGVVFLRYYDGAWVNGTVVAGSTPLPGVRITVTDELGTPHYLTTTDAFGHYSALVPFGDITLTASVGTMTKTTLLGSRTLATTTLHVTLDQAVRSPADLDGDGLPDWILTRDLRVSPQTMRGTAFYDVNRNGTFDLGDVRAARASITISDKEFALRRTTAAALDGSYTIGDLPEGVYSVSVSLEGRTLTLPDVTLTGTAAAHDLSVPFTAVHGTTLSSLGGILAGVQVQFQDATNSTVLAIASLTNGTYRIGPLLAGNYTVTASSGNLSAAPTRIHADRMDLSLDLTLFPSGSVAGATNLFGYARPFATLAFQSAADPGTVRSATSDGNGQYSIRLSAGEWFVTGRFYDGARLFAVLGDVFVVPGTTARFDATFVDGVRVNGTVRDPTSSALSLQANVGFHTAAGQLWLRTDAQGGYLAFLPAGTYDLAAFTATGAFFATVPLPSSARRDISLIPSPEAVSWKVFRDVNGDRIAQPEEQIGGAHIDLVDDRGARVFLTTPATGNLTIPLFANRTYTGSVSAPGYATRSIPSSSLAALRGIVPIALNPTPVPVQGTVLLNGAALVNRPVTLRVAAVGNGAVSATTLTDTNGGFSLSLVPGTYDLVIDENVSTSRDLRYQNLALDRIPLAVGQGVLSHDVRIVTRNRVHGSVALSGSPTTATLTFDGPERRITNATTAGYEVYLASGTYVVMSNRTVGTNDYAFVSTATVPASGNVNFTFANAARARGRAMFQGVAVPGPMTISFSRQGGGTTSVSTDVGGSYTAILAPGTYSVTLNAAVSTTEGGAPRFYRYTFAGSVTVSAGASTLPYDLATTRTLDNTTIRGLASLAGAGVDAVVSFTARGGGAISAQTSAGTNGVYSVALAPGTYDVYATRASSSVAFLARISVPHASSTTRDLPLSGAFLLYGITTNAQGTAISASLTIQSSAQVDLISDASGLYQVFLPPDGYVITATKPGMEKGVSVTYRATKSVTLQSNMAADLVLAKVVGRSVTLTWDVAQKRQIAAGGSVTYSIVVQNTGNVADTFDFMGSPGNWQFAFAPSSASLDFGSAAPSSRFQVVIQSPADALVEHPALHISALASSDRSLAGDVVVQVDITRVRGLSVSLDPTGATFDGRFLNETVRVKNAGNARETVQVAIGNPGDLAAVGWSLSLGTTDGPLVGTTLTNVTVDANQSVALRLRAQSNGGPSGATVVLVVSAQDSMAVSASGPFTLQLPALAPGNVSITGPEVTSSAPPNTLLIAVIVAAAAAAAAGLYLSRRRR